MEGRQWVTGECWMRDAVDVPVLWFGPVHSHAHGTVPFYACEPCIRRLEARASASNARRYGLTAPGLRPAG
ncbi:hypothetical protein FM076_14615 [Streptomyces albus subsp. chlorinus]|uniref:hypothetical protein n=1 Tax=Streptomyces albus TaxID=1888 RepID=UPI00156E9227|nr:hypothetical protein [Streptomyces albus]NSC22351.1 hypothetical protein [Streptomyces albus subsp. chlorinus]